MEFLTACLGRKLIVRSFTERTAFGVAMLVATGSGTALPEPPGTDDRREYALAPPRLPRFLAMQSRSVGLRT
jgi:hypothetical protein